MGSGLFESRDLGERVFPGFIFLLHLEKKSTLEGGRERFANLSHNDCRRLGTSFYKINFDKGEHA